jgi:hypothetical protein
MSEHVSLTAAEARDLHHLVETELQKAAMEPASFEAAYVERLERVKSKLEDGDEVVVGEKAGVPPERVLETMVDGSVVIRCGDAEIAGRLTARLYEAVSGEVFHVEHYPETDDASDRVEAVLLVVRRVCYDRDAGWFSSDASPKPDIVLPSS